MYICTCAYIRTYIHVRRYSVVLQASYYCIHVRTYVLYMFTCTYLFTITLISLPPSLPPSPPLPPPLPSPSLPPFLLSPSLPPSPLPPPFPSPYLLPSEAAMCSGVEPRFVVNEGSILCRQSFVCECVCVCHIVCVCV